MNSLRSLSSYAPTMPHLQLASPQKMMKNLTYIALPMIAMAAMSSIPKADAGFGFFAVCMSACLAATGGFGVMACAAACSASLAPVIP